MAKNIFFIGKGGVGKSTIAALSAVQAAEENSRVLIASLDPAHNLSGIFKISLSEKEKKIISNLWGMEINVQKGVKKYLNYIEEQVNDSYRYLSAFNLDKHFSILRYSPGLEEYALLTAFSDITKKFDEFDYIILDMPPTSLALKFFNLANLSLIWLKKLSELRSQIKHKKEILSKIKFGNKEFETDKVAENLSRQIKFYQTIQSQLKDESRSTISLVMNADTLSLEESRNIQTNLNNTGLSSQKIFLNKLTSDQDFKKYNPYFREMKILPVPLSFSPLIGIDNLKRFLSEHLSESLI